ncbi:MAG: NAD(+)/NADH kinase [Clostridia bacterium]|nr:NAD(+)/NADH kinase [Clostridia bacterium]
MEKMHKVLLLPNTTKKIPGEQIDMIIDRWEKNGCRLYTFAECADFLQNRIPVFHSIDEEKWDAACVLGGDGSIIDAAHRLYGMDIPIVGINFGHLGYLTEMDAGEIHWIDRIVAGEYTLDRRMMLNIEILDEKEHIRRRSVALNDVVLTNGPVARLLTFDLHCSSIHMQTCRADGIIAATPTGSTAYSMSAGGPVLDPSLECICLTPICPHTMSSRPVIVRSSSEIRFTNIISRNTSVYLTSDGREAVELFPGESVRITRSASTTDLIRVRDDGFLMALRRKLSDHFV